MTQSILIAGAGPVGLTAACELARFGLSVRIVDKNEQRTDKSKAIVVWPRTLELLRRVSPNLAEDFLAAGLRAEETRIRAGREEIAHVDLTRIDSPYNFALLIAQSETERLLEEHLLSLGVRVERRTELSRFAQLPDSVSCTLSRPDGSSESLTASWLLGCDGAHSTVRHSLGMEFLGKTLSTVWTLADLHLSGIDGPPAIQIFWHEQGILALFPLGKNRFRLIADVGEAPESPSGSEPPVPSLAELQRILDVRGPGGLVAFDPVWLSNFGINERKVAEYRAARIFLAGDAAHVHSPAGGQGMNTGMQDAFNLCWKLALVARGLCPAEPLLASYSVERSAIAKLVLEATGKATTMALLRGGALQSVRNHVAAWLLGFSSIQAAAAGAISELSVGYAESPLNETSSDAPVGPAPGKRAPVRAAEPPVGASDTPRFALFAAPGGAPQDLLQKYSGILEPQLRRPFHDAGLWLVRPDGYVAVATHSGDWSAVRQFLDRVSGAPAQSSRATS